MIKKPSQLDARFAALESNLTVSNYCVGNFKFSETSNLSFLKKPFFEKITKNVISRKLQKLEQSDLESKIEINGKTLRELHCRYENFKFWEMIYIKVL